MNSTATWLAVDTSTYVGSVAVWRAGRVLSERVLDSPLPGPGLLGEIEAALALAEISLPEIDAFAVGLGPGAFTSLRVGLATIKGLAYALDRPVAGVPSLLALAARARRLEVVGEGELCVPVLDARRGEVYAAAFGAAGERLLSEHAASPEALGAALAALSEARVASGQVGVVRTVGAGAVQFAQRIGFAAAKDPALAAPHAAEIGALASSRGVERAVRGAELYALAPWYIRPPDAEVAKK